MLIRPINAASFTAAPSQEIRFGNRASQAYRDAQREAWYRDCERRGEAGQREMAGQYAWERLVDKKEEAYRASINKGKKKGKKRKRLMLVSTFI